MGEEQGMPLSASVQSIKYKIAHSGLFPIPYQKGIEVGNLHLLAGLTQELWKHFWLNECKSV